MKVRIPIMIQDPMTSEEEEIPAVEGFDPANEEFFLDGPVTKRIAVLDFSPETGNLEKGAIFKPPPAGRVRGWYESEDGVRVGKELYKPAFIQVSVFATVLKTLYLFEGTDHASSLHREFGKEKVEETLTHTLCRPLTWAFDSPQLLVVPRAGQWANAFYNRDSHALQFFYFPSPRDPKKRVYTCLSRDIVAHETGHAIVDGIAPDLLDACTPQSLAIHEAIADLTALLMAFDSHTLRKLVFEKFKGSLKDSTAFSFIAEEFGNALKGTRGLRNLYNEKNMNAKPDQNTVRRDEPHALSEVLSGALYRVMIHIHEDLKVKYARTREYAKFRHAAFSASGRSLWDAARRLKRMAFRALDYLPPGEVSFADYGRAMIAVDQVAYPGDDKMRNWLRDEFLRRHIVRDKAALNVQTNLKHEALKEYDAATLYSSDWAAYDFANKNRDLLFVPDKPEPIRFEVRPRLHLIKKYDPNHPRTLVGHECIFKVAWNHRENNPIGSGYPRQRAITVGTTLAIMWEPGEKTGEILARLTSAPPTEPSAEGLYIDDKQRRLAEEEYKQQRKDRDMFLLLLAEEELLKIGKHAIGPDGRPLLSAIQAEVIGDVMRTRGTGKFLHIIGRGGEV